MQDKKYLATIVPLGPQARKQIQKGENLDVIRAAVWSETAKKLTPLLGSVCSRFLPATYAWSICNYRPFGVMLGGVTADMEDMLLCYTRARLEQMNEIEARQQRLISRGETLLNESPIQSLNITVVSIDSSNPGTRKELELAQKFFSGDVSAAAGIYYLGYNCNQISESQEEQLLENLQEYALCVAELQELEVALWHFSWIWRAWPACWTRSRKPMWKRRNRSRSTLICSMRFCRFWNWAFIRA